MGQKIAGYRNLPLDLVGHILSFNTLLPKYAHLSNTLYEFSRFNLQQLDIMLQGNILLRLEYLGRDVEYSNKSYEAILYAIHKYPFDDIRCYIMQIARINRFLYRIPKSMLKCSLTNYMYRNSITSIKNGYSPQIGWVGNKIYKSYTGSLASYHLDYLYDIFRSLESISIISRLNLVDRSHKYYLLFEWMQLYNDKPLTIGELILKHVSTVGIDNIDNATASYILKLLLEIPKDKRLMFLKQVL